MLLGRTSEGWRWRIRCWARRTPATAAYGAVRRAAWVAIALVLRHVVRWNRPATGERYDELGAKDIEARLCGIAEAAGLPLTLREAGIGERRCPGSPRRRNAVDREIQSTPVRCGRGPGNLSIGLMIVGGPDMTSGLS